MNSFSPCKTRLIEITTSSDHSTHVCLNESTTTHQTLLKTVPSSVRTKHIDIKLNQRVQARYDQTLIVNFRQCIS